VLRDQSNANRVQCEPNPDGRDEKKEKEILVAVPTAVLAAGTTIISISISLFVRLAVDKQY
jgi:hypothetical protein